MVVLPEVSVVLEWRSCFVVQEGDEGQPIPEVVRRDDVRACGTIPAT